MYLKIFLESINLGDSGRLQTPTVFGRLILSTFILSVAPPRIDSIKVIVRRKKDVLSGNLSMVISFLVFPCPVLIEGHKIEYLEAISKIVDHGEKSGSRNSE
jgi:hypothetical protein